MTAWEKPILPDSYGVTLGIRKNFGGRLGKFGGQTGLSRWQIMRWDLWESGTN
jgi:hypothetical protein